MTRNLLLVLVAAGLVGCTIGRRAESLDFATSPRGAAVELQTVSGSIRGELVEVQDTALLVLRGDRRLVLVAYGTIRHGNVEMMREITLGGQPPRPGEQERMRRLSRYPQGVDGDLRRALLAAYGQDEVEVVR